MTSVVECETIDFVTESAHELSPKWVRIEKAYEYARDRGLCDNTRDLGRKLVKAGVWGSVTLYGSWKTRFGQRKNFTPKEPQLLGFAKFCGVRYMWLIDGQGRMEEAPNVGLSENQQTALRRLTEISGLEYQHLKSVLRRQLTDEGDVPVGEWSRRIAGMLEEARRPPRQDE